MSVLDETEFVAPIECANPACPNTGELFNAVLMPLAEEDAFYEGFGQGAEDSGDFCPHCGDLGLLLDPEVPDRTVAGHIPNCLLVVSNTICSCKGGK